MELTHLTQFININNLSGDLFPRFFDIISLEVGYMDFKWWILIGAAIVAVGGSLFFLMPEERSFETRIEEKVERNAEDKMMEKVMPMNRFTLSDIPDDFDEEDILDFKVLDESFRVKFRTIEIQNMEENLKVMISAGEKRTGGYSIDIENVFLYERNIIVHAFLNIPKGPTTQAFTYPSKVIAIDKSQIEPGEWNLVVVLEDDQKTEEVLMKTIVITNP
jgi:hypothetical protein